MSSSPHNARGLISALYPYRTLLITRITSLIKVPQSYVSHNVSLHKLTARLYDELSPSFYDSHNLASCGGTT